MFFSPQEVSAEHNTFKQCKRVHRLFTISFDNPKKFKLYKMDLKIEMNVLNKRNNTKKVINITLHKN